MRDLKKDSDYLTFADPLLWLFPFAVGAAEVTLGSFFNGEPLYPPLLLEVVDLVLLGVAIFLLGLILEEFEDLHIVPPDKNSRTQFFVVSVCVYNELT